MSRLCACHVMIGLLSAMAVGCGLDASSNPSPSGGAFAANDLIIRKDLDTDQIPVSISPVFTNHGTKRLDILEVKTGCACTLVDKLSKYSLLPGDSVPIPLRITPPAHGRQSLRVEVLTEPASQEGSLRLTVIGDEVKTPHMINLPDQLLLVYTHLDRPVAVQGRISTLEARNSSPWLVGVGVGEPGLQGWEVKLNGPLDEEPSISSEAVTRHYAVTLSGAPRTPLSNPVHITARLVAKSEDGEQSIPPPIRFRVQYMPLCRCLPEKITFSDHPDHHTQTCLIVFHDTSDWSVESVSQMPSWLSHRIMPTNGAPTNRLKVSLSISGTPVGNQLATIMFNVSNTAEERATCTIDVGYSHERNGDESESH